MTFRYFAETQAMQPIRQRMGATEGFRLHERQLRDSVTAVSSSLSRRPQRIACLRNHLGRGATGVLFLLIAAVGCQRDGKVPVAGIVKWNGAALEEGHLILTPNSASNGADAGPIKNGAFAFRASLGSKRVEVFADRAVGPIDPVMKTQAREQFIPTRFNEQTELKAEVTDGENRWTFDLKEQPGDKKAGEP